MNTWKKILYRGIQFLFIFTIVVCSKKGNEKKDTAQLASMEDSTIVAIVNGEVIHFQDVDNAAKQMIANIGISNKITYKDSVIQTQALDWLIANKLLRQEVKNHVIEVTKYEVDEAIRQIKKIFPSEDKFIEALHQQNLSQREFEENVILDLKVQKLLEQQVIANIGEIDRKEAKKYYHENTAKYQKKEEVRARHILIRVKQDAKEAEVRKARRKAQAILAQLKNGKDFEELAETYSEGPSAAKGGDLGYFCRGDMVKSFEDEVFSLKPGELSDIIRTDFGFHIIKVEDFKKPRQIPFEEVENEIKNYLRQEKSNQLFKQYIDKLKQKSKINIIKRVS